MLSQSLYQIRWNAVAALDLAPSKLVDGGSGAINCAATPPSLICPKHLFQLDDVAGRSTFHSQHAQGFIDGVALIIEDNTTAHTLIGQRFSCPQRTQRLLNRLAGDSITRGCRCADNLYSIVGKHGILTGRRGIVK